MQHIYAPDKTGHRAARHERHGQSSHRDKCRFGNYSLDLGHFLRELRSRIRLPREVEHQRRYRRKTLGYFDRRAAVAFVQYQVGR